MSHPIELSESTFDAEVLQSKLPVLVDIWAPWCGPCLAVAPAIESISDEFDGKLKVGKLNIDDNPMLGQRYGVTSIPSLILFNAGSPVKGLVGAASKAKIVEWMKPVID